MQKGGLDWHHLEEELAGIAKPIRELAITTMWILSSLWRIPFAAKTPTRP